MRAAYIDMTNESNTCPQGLEVNLVDSTRTYVQVFTPWCWLLLSHLGPWFTTTLSDNIEVNWCFDQGPDDEDLAVDQLDIYVY